MTQDNQPSDNIEELSYGDVVRALNELEGKNDQASADRRNQLLDKLITLDMAMQRYRKPMGTGKSYKLSKGAH